MDKNTLSNYGWVVIAVLVLAVMIALATPFGEYIKAGVESTTAGLFDTSEKAMNVVGMTATNQDANKVQKTGSYITLDNVSSTPHTLGITLSSNTVTDFSSVSVTRYGSNLLDMSKVFNEYLIDNGDGTYTQTKGLNSRQFSATYGIFIPAGTPLYAGIEIIDSTLTRNYGFQFTLEDGSKQYLYLDTKNNDAVTYDKNIIEMCFSIPYACAEGEYITFSEPRLNVGFAAPYQDFVVSQTVTAQANGTVTGLTSVSPNMTIITNNSDTNITCEYQKKN